MSASSQIVLVGHPFAPIGMGEHVRSVWRSFAQVGETPAIYDIYGLSERNDADIERVFGPAQRSQISSGVNIFHINGDEIAQSLARINAPDAFAKAYNVVYPAWELSKYPSVWARELERFDEIWAPSKFIGDSLADSVSKPVVHMPLAVDVTMSSYLTRRQLDLPESGFIFLFFFDFSSYLARKNPFAVIEAFEALADRHPKAPLHLVLKHKGDKGSAEAVNQLKAALARRPGQIHIVDRTLTDNEVKNLVRAADCFVSLHRSEGFGRGMAEAMALGVPTVATGYSGNMDFMTPENSWLVTFDLAPVGAGEYPQAAGQHWAAPRVSDAIAHMEQIVLDRGAARAKAARARRDIAAYFSPRACGLRYLDRLAQVDARRREVA